MEKMHYIYKGVLPILTALLLILSSTAQVFTQEPPALVRPDTRFTHTVIFDVNGEISIKRQLGHACTTGAVKKTTVKGYGEMTKTETVRMAGNIINVDEYSDWSVPADSLNSLNVATTLELCSRPMAAAAAVYNGLKIGDIINIYDPAVVSGALPVNNLTEQIWSTAITTNAGFSGSYHSDFIAAYGPGPYERLYGALDPKGEIFFYDEDFMWTYDPNVHYGARDNKSTFANVSMRGYPRGDNYVGNYFSINQFAYTSGGELRRLISMSNPFENSLIIEDVHVVGMASIRESFDNHGLIGGPKAVTLAWYELF